MSGPLEGVRVLDLTRLLPGGYATLMLADLGADVIKIEEPGRGDYIRWIPPMAGEYSASHIALNRNKRSVTLNLKLPSAKELFRRLAKECDVVIESFRPGVMDRLDIGWESLRALNPRLVYCAITGYGQDGPRSQVAGHDVNYIGYAGILGIIGEEGRGPVIPGVQIGDLAGGGMCAVISILAALQARSSTGEGTFCDVSMMDGAFSWLSVHAADFVARQELPERELMLLSGGHPCYRLYPAADGWISVGALEPQFWAALCDAIGRPDLIGDAFATGRRRDEVITELEELFETKTRADWVAHFEGLDVCVGPVNDLAEAFADEQIRQRGMLVEERVDGVGDWAHVGNPIRLAGYEQGRLVRRPPPALGEHTDEVLKEIGVSVDEISQLRAAGAV